MGAHCAAPQPIDVGCGLNMVVRIGNACGAAHFARGGVEKPWLNMQSHFTGLPVEHVGPSFRTPGRARGGGRRGACCLAWPIHKPILVYVVCAWSALPVSSSHGKSPSMRCSREVPTTPSVFLGLGPIGAKCIRWRPHPHCAPPFVVYASLHCVWLWGGMPQICKRLRWGRRRASASCLLDGFGGCGRLASQGCCV